MAQITLFSYFIIRMISNCAFYQVFLVIPLILSDKLLKKTQESGTQTPLARSEIGVVSEILSLVIFPERCFDFVRLSITLGNMRPWSKVTDTLMVDVLIHTLMNRAQKFNVHCFEAA